MLTSKKLGRTPALAFLSSPDFSCFRNLVQSEKPNSTVLVPEKTTLKYIETKPNEVTMGNIKIRSEGKRDRYIFSEQHKSFGMVVQIDVDTFGRIFFVCKKITGHYHVPHGICKIREDGFFSGDFTKIGSFCACIFLNGCLYRRVNRYDH